MSSSYKKFNCTSNNKKDSKCSQATNETECEQTKDEDGNPCKSQSSIDYLNLLVIYAAAGITFALFLLTMVFNIPGAIEGGGLRFILGFLLVWFTWPFYILYYGLNRIFNFNPNDKYPKVLFKLFSINSKKEPLLNNYNFY